MPRLVITEQEKNFFLASLAVSQEMRARVRKPPVFHVKPVVVVPDVVMAPLPSVRERASRRIYSAPIGPFILPDGVRCGSLVDPNRPSWAAANIIAWVAEHFGVSEDDIVGPTRRAVIVTPRHIAFYLVKRDFPTFSLGKIGKIFGGRDHSTALHAIRKGAEMVRQGKVVVPPRPFWLEARSDHE